MVDITLDIFKNYQGKTWGRLKKSIHMLHTQVWKM